MKRFMSKDRFHKVGRVRYDSRNPLAVGVVKAGELSNEIGHMTRASDERVTVHAAIDKRARKNAKRLKESSNA